MSAPSHTPYPARTAGLHPDTPAWLGLAFNAAEFARRDDAHVRAVLRMGGFPRRAILRGRTVSVTPRRA